MGESVVYAIAAGNRVKIGYTNDIARRMREIQCASSLPIVCIGSAPGGRPLERALHRQFALHRVYGEWFELPDDQRQVLRLRLAGEPHFVKLPRAGKRAMLNPKRSRYAHRIHGPREW